jgi:hypothetical protein
MEWILVIVIRHNIFFEKKKMRIAVYNLQCTVYSGSQNLLKNMHNFSV